MIYNEKQIRSPRMCLLQYNDEDFRLVYMRSCRDKGYEEIKKDGYYIPKTEPTEVERISLSRTKRRIREIALCNDFKYFATITINSEYCDRFDLTKCQDLLRAKLKKIKRIYHDFRYVFITERHKNGAFHFHGLVSELPTYINSNGYLSCSILDDVGFNSFSIINDYSKCCNYITKYITKDCVKNENNQIYICSRGLKKPVVHNLPISFDFPFNYSNDYCSISDFKVSELSPDLLLRFLSV